MAEETVKLPKGLHRFYRNDKFSDALFWFVAGLTFVCGKSDADAANEFREFLGLDEDQASVRSLLTKYYRMKKDFIDILPREAAMIEFRETDDVAVLKEVAIELLKEIRAKNSKPVP